MRYVGDAAARNETLVRVRGGCAQYVQERRDAKGLHATMNSIYEPQALTVCPRYPRRSFTRVELGHGLHPAPLHDDADTSARSATTSTVRT